WIPNHVSFRGLRSWYVVGSQLPLFMWIFLYFPSVIPSCRSLFRERAVGYATVYLRGSDYPDTGRAVLDQAAGEIIYSLGVHPLPGIENTYDNAAAEHGQPAGIVHDLIRTGHELLGAITERNQYPGHAACEGFHLFPQFRGLGSRVCRHLGAHHIQIRTHIILLIKNRDISVRA